MESDIMFENESKIQFLQSILFYSFTSCQPIIVCDTILRKLSILHTIQTTWSSIFHILESIKAISMKSIFVSPSCFLRIIGIESFKLIAPFQSNCLLKCKTFPIQIYIQFFVDTQLQLNGPKSVRVNRYNCGVSYQAHFNCINLE